MLDVADVVDLTLETTTDGDDPATTDPHFWQDPLLMADARPTRRRRSSSKVDPRPRRRLRRQRRRPARRPRAARPRLRRRAGGLRARHDRGQPRRVRLPRPLRADGRRRSPASPPTPSRPRPTWPGSRTLIRSDGHHHRVLRAAGQPAGWPRPWPTTSGIAPRCSTRSRGSATRRADEDYLSLMRENLAALRRGERLLGHERRPTRSSSCATAPSRSPAARSCAAST